MSFTFISLFSGIGGFELALNKHGGKCVFASEIDKHARKSYKAIFGYEPYGDITKIKADDIPCHDILTAGFPCQSFSIAGKRAGLNDTRGTLFYEIRRIAEKKQPKVLLLENVKGLLSNNKGKTIDTVVAELNNIGYVVDFEILNSKYFEVPQSRERVYFVCIREDLVKAEPWNLKGRKNNVLTKTKKRINEWAKTFNFFWPEQKKVKKKLKDILQSNVDEKYYISEEKAKKLVEQLKKDKDLKQVGYINKKMQGNIVYDPEGVSATLTSQTGGLGGKGVTLLKEEPNQKMLGLLSSTKSLNDAGNGHRTHILEREEVPSWISKPDELSKTIRVGGKGSLNKKDCYDFIAEELTPEKTEIKQQGCGYKEKNTQERQKIVTGKHPKYRIRKLTPRECWRLQGFKDKYFNKAKEAGISSSQLYRQAGNAVTVNVIDELVNKLSYFLPDLKHD